MGGGGVVHIYVTEGGGAVYTSAQLQFQYLVNIYLLNVIITSVGRNT